MTKKTKSPKQLEQEKLNKLGNTIEKLLGGKKYIFIIVDDENDMISDLTNIEDRLGVIGSLEMVKNNYLNPSRLNDE